MPQIMMMNLWSKSFIYRGFRNMPTTSAESCHISYSGSWRGKSWMDLVDASRRS